MALFKIATTTDLTDLEARTKKHTELVMMNLVQQIRAILVASKISPQDFFKAFTDAPAQDKYFADLSKVEQEFNLKRHESAGSEKT